jgi:hypothetical protein
MKTKRFALLALLTLAGAVPAFSGTSFTPTGVIDMIPTSMSNDASIVVGTGTSGVPNLYYTEAGGAVVIGDGCFSGLPAISGDGTTVLACHTDEQGSGTLRDGSEARAGWISVPSRGEFPATSF